MLSLSKIKKLFFIILVLSFLTGNDCYCMDEMTADKNEDKENVKNLKYLKMNKRENNEKGIIQRRLKNMFKKDEEKLTSIKSLFSSSEEALIDYVKGLIKGKEGISNQEIKENLLKKLDEEKKGKNEDEKENKNEDDEEEEVEIEEEVEEGKEQEDDEEEEEEIEEKVEEGKEQEDDEEEEVEIEEEVEEEKENDIIDKEENKEKGEEPKKEEEKKEDKKEEKKEEPKKEPKKTQEEDNKEKEKEHEEEEEEENEHEDSKEREENIEHNEEGQPKVDNKEEKKGEEEKEDNKEKDKNEKGDNEKENKEEEKNEKIKGPKVEIIQEDPKTEEKIEEQMKHIRTLKKLRWCCFSAKPIVSLLWSYANSIYHFEEIELDKVYFCKYILCVGYRWQPDFMKKRDFFFDININPISVMHSILCTIIKYKIDRDNIDSRWKWVLAKSIFYTLPNSLDFNLNIKIKDKYFAINFSGLMAEIISMIFFQNAGLLKKKK